MSDTLNAAFDVMTSRIGEQTSQTEWFQVTQERINDFAEVTMDHQWIHIDAERAAKGPFGATIAHGYLTMSLAAKFMPEIIEVRGIATFLKLLQCLDNVEHICIISIVI